MSSGLPQGWEDRELGNLLILKYGKDHKKLKDGDIPVYGSGGIMRYANEYLYDKESILIPRKGTLSNMFFLKEAFWTVDTIFWSIINEELIDGKFLFYNLKTINLANLNIGSAVPSLTTKVLNQVNIKYPSDINEQKRIADILSAFDDKIEINNQINQTLEEMASALFKEWFENFNFPNNQGKPYKDNGGEMKPSELGEIPIDWEVKRIFETDIVIEDGDRGRNYPNNSELSNKGFCPFLNNKNIIGDYINFDKTDFITEKKFNAMGKGIVSVNDIVLTTRGSIGNVGLFHRNLPFKFSRINSGMVIIKNDKDFTCNYLYSLLKSKEMKNQFMSISSGSVQKQLPIRDLKNLVLLKPLKNIQIKFEDIIKPFFEQIQQNQQQNQILKQQRDALLPKLISGEIRV